MRGKFVLKKTAWLVLLVFIMAIGLTGCGSASQTTSDTPAKSEPKLALHPASNSTVAASTEPLGAFSLDEIGATNIVDVAFVESKIGDSSWVIVDGREKAEYEQGHIPGAVHFGDGIWKVLKHPMDGRVIPADRMAKILGEHGISNDKKVIIYGKTGDYHVTCEMGPVYIGLSEWDYLSGGYEAWVAAGKTVETTAVTPVPVTFTPQVVNENMYVSTSQLAEIVAAGDAQYYLLDTRSVAEFNGLGMQGIRAGRIPGATNFPPEVNLEKDSKALLSSDKLAEVYKDVPKDKTVILYCHRGCRTGFAFLALRSLGYKDVRVYEDSFVVWNMWLELPVEEEHFLNYRGDLSKTVEKAGVLWKEAGKK
ncbi:MAG: hypothetical protein CVU89_14925 [Firmicutes bacterium HGW-Firmicutes-14]|nr:MAG: hypothetical protein CVU89_14925 [Firmicutes bacterium HGW-Firmicutes-14]